MARRTNSDILTRFEDGLESGLKRHKKTIAAIEAAMGKPPPEAKAAVMVVQRGQRRPLRAAARITLEDGAVLCAHDALPGDLPAGHHMLRYFDEDRDTKLIVSLGVCHLAWALACVRCPIRSRWPLHNACGSVPLRLPRVENHELF